MGVRGVREVGREGGREESEGSVERSSGNAEKPEER
jgi:hypothetical protein